MREREKQEERTIDRVGGIERLVVVVVVVVLVNIVQVSSVLHIHHYASSR